MRPIPCVLLVILLTTLPTPMLTMPAAAEEADMSEQGKTRHANGKFDVQMIPQQPGEGDPEIIGRMLIDKRYHGPLDGTGKGQFLGVRTATEGSAGYVAMELVVGSLDGKAGSFVLQHSGTMDRGELSLDLEVVPDSGTGELAGLSGSMQIVIEEGGDHFYEFHYTLESPSAEE